MAYLCINSRDKKYHLEAADEETPRKRLISLLKLALDLMDGICLEREFHNWDIDGRNDDLAWHRLQGLILGLLLLGHGIS